VPRPHASPRRACQSACGRGHRPPRGVGVLELGPRRAEPWVTSPNEIRSHLLWPVHQSGLPELTRLYSDPTWPGDYQWFGFRIAKAREIERRWSEDGLIGGPGSTLTVALEDGTCVGVVSWRPVGETGNFEIGIWVHPEHRGRGIGTEAQRQLVDYLFATTPVHRIQASTEVDNIPEQRALQRIGFQREGVLRGYGFRDGRWRDGVWYGVLRDDPRAPSRPSGSAHSSCVMCDRAPPRRSALRRRTQG
jgi:RimJ/RimL family protein N-acetyltransferase